MYCPRIDHFVRLNNNGTIGKCGHMVSPPQFDSWQQMQSSDWLANLKLKMDDDVWPVECQRCQDTEQISNQSIRTASLKKHKLLSHFDPQYLILGGVLDNICNSACQSCNEHLSTKIGSLHSRNYTIIDNSHLLENVPWPHVIELDLNGGEPTASPRYQHLLQNLPDSIKIIRVNTNGSRLLPNIHNILKRGVKLIITLSLDGTGPVHDYVRWPIRWVDYQLVVEQYKQLRDQYSNLELQAWTVLHALNLADFDNIIEFCKQHNIGHNWALLDEPKQLDPKHVNLFTTTAQTLLQSAHPELASSIAIGPDNQVEIDLFIKSQDKLRNITFRDYLQ